MKWCLVILLCCTAISEALSQPVAVREFAKLTEDNVYRVNATWTSGATRSGYAYLVAQRDGTSTLITARHVVFEEVQGAYVAADEVQVRLATGAGPAYVVSKAKVPVRALDLAVIDFVAKQSSQISTSVLAQSLPAQGEEVWLFAPRADRLVSPTPGVVQEMNGGVVRVLNLGGQLGLSGAPVISQGGVTGIYLGLQEATSSILSIKLIEKTLKDLDFDWGLNDSLLKLPTLTAEFRRVDRLSLSVDVRGSGNQMLFSVPGSYQVPAGPYVLDYDKKLMNCNLGSIFIKPHEPRQTFVVSCTPRLQGKWIGSVYEAVISPIGNGDYQLISVERGGNTDASLFLKGRVLQTTSPLVFQTWLSDLNKRDRSGTLVISESLRELSLQERDGAGGVRSTELKREIVP